MSCTDHELFVLIFYHRNKGSNEWCPSSQRDNKYVVGGNFHPSFVVLVQLFLANGLLPSFVQSIGIDHT